MADRKYDLRPADEYLKFITGNDFLVEKPQFKLTHLLFSDAGFNARADDQSEWFIEILQMEIEKLESMKEEFLVDHSEQDFADLINGWDDKVERVKSKTQTVNKLICIKFI